MYIGKEVHQIGRAHRELSSLLGSAVISWYNKKIIFLALSLAKFEYMVNSQVPCEAIWIKMILVFLFSQGTEPTLIHCDNQSCIKHSKNPVFHDRSKHIDIKYHHLRDCNRRIFMLQCIPTDE